MGVKISGLPDIVTPAFTDVFPVVQGSVTYQESMTQLSSLFATAGANSNITSLTGLTTPLTVEQGGTGLSTTTAYGLIAGGTTATGDWQNVGTGTSGQLLNSNGSSALPSWVTVSFPGIIGATGTILRSNGSSWVASTSTFADTYAVNTLLYASGSNTVTGLAATNSATLVTNGSGVPAWQALTAGQILVGTTSGAPSATSIASGTNITVTNASGSISVAVSGTIGVTNGGTGIATATAYSLIAAGTTATGAWQSVGTGTAGQILSSGGASALPTWSTATFPVVGGAAGNILISNGTNYIASTSLWPNTVGTAGQILRSNGTANAYTTSTFADTYAVSTILYASSANAVTGLGTTNSAALVTNGSGVPAWQALTAGQILVGTTSGAPSATSIGSGTNITVTNSSGSISVAISGTIGVTNGGTGIATATAYGLIAGGTTSTGAFQSIGTGLAGQILSSGGIAALPSWSTATFPVVGGTAGNILISDGTNYISSTSLWPNTVGAVGKILRSDGTTNAYSTSTFADTYAVSTILYASLANTVTGLGATNSATLVSNGSGVPSWQALTAGQILVGTTAGAPSATSIASGTNIAVTNGSGSISVAISGTIAVTNGGTGIATATAYGLIAGGTTATGAFQSIGTGLAGQILSSGGASALPSWSTATFPVVGGTAGNILISNGTNYIASTSLWPNTVGTAGKILRSDGTTNAYTTSTFADTYAVSTLLYASSSNTVAGLATANSSALVTNGSGVPAWQTLTAGQILVGTTSGAPSAATIGSGTNITVTSGSGSISVGISGTIGVTNGGTGIATATAYSLIAAGTTATGAWQSVGTGTAGQILRSGGSAALPAWSTATFPATGGTSGNILISNGTNYISSTSLWPNTVGTAGKILRSDGTSNAYTTSTFADTYSANDILYASSANTVSGFATSASSVLVCNGSGVLVWRTLAAGEILIGTTSTAPAAASLTAGVGISITSASGSITIATSGGGLATATISGTTQTAVVNTQYIALNSGQTTVTLPGTYAVGDVISLIGSTANTGGWILDAPAGDTIRVNNATTSSGGTVTCTAVAGQCIEVVCDVANVSWIMTGTSSVLLTTT